ncbi:hypothetical protein GGX14DRAFT_404152 [Mycena pura]|uniref:Uncharacterized protein n=1 Tax=Mycena pura TaxID=153505 RepID=A0AAD6Y5M7_9AGAR|nr:hypothetical protein GGX14DRAFT_404152 [Mycena pura]
MAGTQCQSGDNRNNIKEQSNITPAVCRIAESTPLTIGTQYTNSKTAPLPCQGVRKDDESLGTTLILLASDAFETYRDATGATLDNSTGLLKITEDRYDNLHDLNFYIGGVRLFSCLWDRADAEDGGGCAGLLLEMI